MGEYSDLNAGLYIRNSGGYEKRIENRRESGEIRSSGGRHSGSSNFSPKGYTEKELKYIFKRIENAIEVGSAKTLLQLAPEFLNYVATTEPRFNEYTGNLGNAYVAGVYVKRKLVQAFYHDTGIKGAIHVSDSGARWVALHKQRHGVRRRVKNYFAGQRGYSKYAYEYKDKPQRRYLKKWEKKSGYRRLPGRGLLGNGAKEAYERSKYAQNWLRIENTAPYASMVQQGGGGKHKHYNVLRGSHIQTIEGKVAGLAKKVLNQELKRAGLKIR